MSAESGYSLARSEAISPAESREVSPVHDLYTAFNLPYVYEYVTKLRRQQVKIVPNHENVQGESRQKI
jgi:hypothetical protein